jgi:hypothetical protein
MAHFLSLIKRALRWLKSAVEESPGVASSIRILMVIASLDVFAVWTLASIHQGKPASIDPPVLGLIAVFVSGKVAQRYAEGN